MVVAAKATSPGFRTVLIKVTAITFILFISAFLLIEWWPAEAQKHSPQPIAADEAAQQFGFKTIQELRGRAALTSNFNEIELRGSKTRVFTWTESSHLGTANNFSAISLDGESLTKIASTDYQIKLRSKAFDPLLETSNRVADAYPGSGSDRAAYIVQFVSQPLEEFRREIRSLGAEIFIYLPNHAYIVQMDRGTVESVSALPFVRWVGRYEPAYKVDRKILSKFENDHLDTRRFDVMALARGTRMQNKIADEITSFGGTVHSTSEMGFILEATLNAEQLNQIAKNEDVMFIDEWSAPEMDMDLVRSTGGANFVENTLGFTGEGVRAEVMDNGLRQTHTDFQSGLIPLIHNSANTSESPNHGTSTFGIVFGRGTTNSAARGMLPDAQGIFADYDFLGSGRYTHTERLLQAPYFAVFQSNSWGTSLTTNYNTRSAELDDILFQNDIALLQSQSNAATQQSRPQAWSKNVVSIGGIRHYNTANLTDDRWASGASTGPAADGRIKPDLAHYYDSIHATENSSNSGYTTSFGGTSAATPITAGHFGIFFQMWHDGLFGNPTGATVFDSRPKMSTSKAIMINTAVQWDMSIAGTDITRVRQGFGRANVENLYNRRSRMKIVNETDVLMNLQSRVYYVNVPVGSSDPLKVTMVYTDPMGTPGASQARVNDLSLRVTSPEGIVYWGNVGLSGNGMWSTAGGSANTVDTVENVFVQAPTSGPWLIEVIASEINEDARPETPGIIDADYGLVISGVAPAAPTAANAILSGRVTAENGNPVRGALIRLVNNFGFERRAYTNSFGYFKIDQVLVGQTYIASVSKPKISFQPSTVAVTVFDNLDDLNFYGNE